MNKKSTTKKNILVYVFVIMIITALIYFVSINDLFDNIQTKNKKNYVHNVQLLISTPNWTTSYTANNTTNVTVASFLFEWAAKKNITVEKNFFSGYTSFFIESIGNYSNGNQNRYWQYYVNDEYSEFGSSSHILNDNDFVLWSYEKSKWT